MARQFQSPKPVLAASVSNSPADATPDPAPPAADGTGPARTVEVAARQDTTEKLPDLKKQLIRAAQMDLEAAFKEYSGVGAGLDRAYQASKRLMDAQKDAALSPAEKAAAAKSHLDRIRDLARLQHGNPSSSDGPSAQVRAYAAEAELWLAQAKTKPPETKATGGGGGSGADTGDEGIGKDPKSRLIIDKLQEPVSMAFADQTPLEDVLKYIQQATVSQDLPSGIPIYVDPKGLEQAGKSINSTVIIKLEGVPLRRTLHLILKQLDLIYSVEDGMLYITSQESEGPLGPPMHVPSPMMLKIDKAERGELTLKEMKDLLEFLKTRNEVLLLGEGTTALGVAGPRAVPAPTQQAAAEEPKRSTEQMDLLLTEMRELIGQLKTQKQTKSAGESK
jgi:hypothetical protein